MLLNPSKLFKRSPLLTRFSILILLVLGGSHYVATRLLRSTLPPHRMQLFPDGSLSPVFIERDANGIPHIQARTDDDAFYAIGYAQAQDRLWQLEMQRRMIHGEMSELFGEASLQQDIWFRSLNLYSAAQTAWPALSDQARNSLQKYVEGINAGIAAQSELPVEFRLFGIRPQRWTPFDSLARLKVFALDLSGSFQFDLTREVARRALTTAQLHTLFPDSGLEGAPGNSRGQAAGKVDAAARFPLREAGREIPPWVAPSGAGCNAWAVAGRHADGGAALLASDCHMDLQIPSPWYMVHAKGQTLAVSGMSLVGVPIVIFGRNDRISWGGANLSADTQDVYFENTDGDGRYETQGRWSKFETRNVTIKVRAESSFPLLRAQEHTVSVQLRAIRNGPVLSDQFDGFERPVSLRWVGFDPGDTSYEALYRLQFASDWQAFRAALSVHVTPALNVIYADVDGNIGSVAAGKVPIRKRGSGALPAPDWDNSFVWEGYISANRLRTEYDPTSGFIVAANHKAVGPDYPYMGGQDWASPASVKRIAQLLEERLKAGKRLNLTDMQRIQGDVIDLDAAALTAELVKMRPNGDEQTKALRSLEGWNGAMAAGSQPAVIFNVWARHLRKQLLDDKLRWYWNKPEQGAYLRNLEQQMSIRALRQALEECEPVWGFARAGGDTSVGCEAMLQTTFQAALDEIGRVTGSRDMSEWRWDAMQQAVYVHWPLGQWPLFNRLFERRTAQGGSQNTVNAAGSSFVDNEGFAQRVGGSFRQVISLGRGAIVHEFMNSTGQSGNVASPHYADMVEPFARLEFYTLAPESAVAPSQIRNVAAGEVIGR
jgi:penicillin amidase